MRIACTTLACPDWSLETVLARFKKHGYDGVDFRGLGAQLDVWKLAEFSTDADKSVRLVARSGLAVSAFSSSARIFHTDPALRARHLEEVAHYTRLCRMFKAPLIRVFGGPLENTPVDKAIEVAVTTLRQLADIAGDGVTLAVETHDEWIHSAMLGEVMQRVAVRNVGVLWDLHHPYRLAGETPRQTYDNIGRFVIATHVKDSLATPGGKYEYRLGGQGDVPLAEMVALLKRGGYDGYLTLEWEKKWHAELAEPDVALPQYAGFLRGLAV
jgi:sugar phosphate isomerase/epimerase